MRLSVVSFTKYLKPHSAVKVGSQEPGIIKNQFTLQSAPYFY